MCGDKPAVRFKLVVKTTVEKWVKNVPTLELFGDRGRENTKRCKDLMEASPEFKAALPLENVPKTFLFLTLFGSLLYRLHSLELVCTVRK
jgi:hypothetical protein